MPYSGSYGGFLADCADLADVVSVSHSPKLVTGRQLATQTVVSEVATVQTPADARGDVRVLERDSSCVRAFAKDDREGWKQGPITVVRLPRERPASVAYVVRTTSDYKGLEIDTEYTIELVAVGAQEALLVTIADHDPFDAALRSRLLSTLLGRVGEAA
jgi:hypothetical protein